MEIIQYAVHWVRLDPSTGGEVSKTRPCVVISPDEMNQFLRTIIIAPLTHTIKNYPSRVECEIDGDRGSIMLDQIRTVDRSRLGSRLGVLDKRESYEIKHVINEMFC